MDHRNRNNLRDLGLDNGFLDVTPEAQVIKEKLDKLVFIKSKNFCASKDNTRKMKRQLTEWERACVS